ncbi:hypothetical protein [Methylovulum psychrotolerans]|uniref:Uncharacterized protein n=1 Tax=Methylovulum psychrotolerans TaxID=1704499 RepID=A0A2S5CJA0_9GAMM|nr:hypothetical protein [Methylovulum psychrotolerans]POZ50884.1 hypothetical protein AADEFJLK_03356 [Methylovulum psychrotolerans]
MKVLSMIVVILIGLSVSKATLGGEYIDQVKLQLAMIKLTVLSEGWKETHDAKFDRLDEGDSDSFSFNLRKGNSYKIVSVCDKDCSDLDLALYDENGNKISKDAGIDSMPVVEATPKWTGNFSLKVKMYSCKSNPCYFGISILGR